MRITSRFGSNVVAGTWVSKTEVQCSSPEHAEGNVYVEISPSAQDSYSNDRVWVVIIIRGICKTTKYARNAPNTSYSKHSHTLTDPHPLSTHTCTPAQAHAHTILQPERTLEHTNTRICKRARNLAIMDIHTNIRTHFQQ